MPQDIHFGTDGWRATIAEDYTFDNVRRCAQGFADYFISQGNLGQWIVIGYDQRFLSDQFARAAAEVLAGNGLRVYLTNTATPTPVIAFAVTNKKAAGAINITASHNPPIDNGFKVRDHNGGAIPPDGLEEIEQRIPDSVDDVRIMPAVQAEKEGKLVVFDPAPPYLEHIQEMIDLKPIRNAGLKILVDPMWGNGIGWFSKLLQGGKTQVTEIHNSRHPLFPEMQRPEPIPPNIDMGLKTTVERGADVLLITDGDADRLGIGDEKGQFINQLQAYALLAYYLLEVRGMRGAIVKTLSTTSMLNKLGKLYNVPVHETGVGFKYVAPKMIETDALIGGEESGGYAFRGNVPERDGILAGLYFLDMLVKLDRKPSELIDLLHSVVGPHYYDRIDRKFTGNRQKHVERILGSKPETVGGLKVISLDTTDGYKFSLEDGGWMLIRFSGTEPIIRVYCETTHHDRVRAILEDGLKIAGIE